MKLPKKQKNKSEKPVKKLVLPKLPKNQKNKAEKSAKEPVFPKKPAKEKTQSENTKKQMAKPSKQGKHQKTAAPVKMRKKSIKTTIFSFIILLSVTSIAALALTTYNITKINKSSEYISKNCLDNIVLVDASGTVDEVHARIIKAYDNAFGENKWV